ncbi:hypothetical protein ABW20_dc0106827 [Dactylellina cionopaga]|nr:hypothetical protein ABW20_dc0106827 [Dactylellina cionopaga]
MATSPVVLILGSGPRVGAAVAKKFASSGYKVAVVSRKGSGTKTAEGYLSLKADFANFDSVPALFDAVKAEFHAFPSVVIYNAAGFTKPPNNDSIFSIPAGSLATDMNTNTISAYVAAQQTVKGWETLPKETKKAFIYTGNISNVSIVPMPMTVNLGIGKSASSYWIGLADSLYSPQGLRFFYADERNKDGSIKGMALDGDAHAEFYIQLAKQDDHVPWHATFVKDQGYVKFN